MLFNLLLIKFVHILFHYLNLEQVVTRHVDIFWNVDFDSQTLSGEVVLQFDIVAKEIENIVRYIYL